MLQVCRVLSSPPAIAACRAAAPAVLALVPPLSTLQHASAAAWQQQNILANQIEGKCVRFSRAYGATATAAHAEPSGAHPSARPTPGAAANVSSTAATDRDHLSAPAAGSVHAGAAGMTPLVPHPGMQKHGVPWGGSSAAGVPVDVAAVMRQPVYTREYMESIKPYHVPPKELHQRLALRTINTVRKTFDLATGYNPETMNEAKWLRRIIFLETVAGVPGMVGGMLRHLRSLRMMQKDNGWINTLLEEAENERMHLLTFMEMRQPGRLFRGWVLLAQGVMFNMLFVVYLASPKFVHSLVGYLEEEAVKTYTHALKDIDAGRIWHDRPAPPIAQAYWRLPADATMRDLILAVRADEACHSRVNHTFAALPQDEVNPFTGKGGEVLP